MSIDDTTNFARIVDQHGVSWLHVQTTMGGVWLSLLEQVEPSKAVEKLASIGIYLPSGKRRTAFFEHLMTVQDCQTQHIVDQTGWHEGRFALGDGTQIVADGMAPLPTMIAVNPRKWTTAGTAKGWKRGVALPLTDQPIPMFAIMFGFLGPIMRFLDCWTNPGVELVGDRGTGKSTVLELVASIYGGAGGSDDFRYWETWNVTVAGMETLLAGHSNCVLLLDELNALSGGSTAAAKRKSYNDILFNLGFGIDRTRFGGKATKQRHFCYLSTSNTSLVQELRGGDPKVVAAASDRLLMVRADGGVGLGIFGHVPEGFDGINELIASLKQSANENHGVIIRGFLQQLVNHGANDPDGLTEDLKEWAGEFEARVKSEDVSGSRARTASTFAAVYAAGKLAQRYGILPKRWACGAAVMFCYRQHVLDKSGALGGPSEQIKAYSSLPDVITSDKPETVPLHQFRTSAGLISGKRSVRELWVDPKALRERIMDAVPLVKALREMGIADCDPGMLQTKRQIGGKSVRVHAFRLAKS
jgi:hypothetical protein